MVEIIQFMFSSFWIFVGFMMILGMILAFIFSIWNMFWRHNNIRKHGYPPEHCDADGELKEEHCDTDKNNLFIK